VGRNINLAPANDKDRAAKAYMERHRKRPTLDELKELSPGLLRIEIAQLCMDAALADNSEVLADAEALSVEPNPQPERIVELWNRLRSI
jgi:hypothetical protein